MSLINKMLHDLDRRDMPQPETASRNLLKATDTASTRPVSIYMIIVTLFLVLLVAALFWLFQQNRLSLGRVTTEPATTQETDPGSPVPPPDPALAKDEVQRPVAISTLPRKRLVAAVIKNEQPQPRMIEKVEPESAADQQEMLMPEEGSSNRLDTPDEADQVQHSQPLYSQDVSRSLERDAESAALKSEEQLADPGSRSLVMSVEKPDTRRKEERQQIKKSHARNNSPERILTETRRYLRTGRLQEAESLLRQAMSNNPENPQSRELLVTLLIQDERSEEAVALLEQSMSRSPDHTPYLLLRARLFMAMDESEKGVTLLEEHLVGREHEADYLTLLGALYQQQRRYRKALELYRQLVQLQPGSGRVWAGLALSLDALGEAPAALEAYQQALGRYPLPVEIERYARQRVTALKVEYEQ